MHNITSNYHSLSIISLLVISLICCISIFKLSDKKWVLASSRVIHSGYGNPILAMAGILWASSVSVFGSDLKDQWFEKSPISWESTFFAATVCLAIFLGCLHYVEQQRREREREARPNIIAVRRAADDGARLTKILYSCLDDWRNVQSLTNKDDLDNLDYNIKSAKKECLKSMLEVARLWDETDKEKITYKANLFNIISSKELKSSFESDAQFIGPVPNRKEKAFFDIESIESSPFFLFSDNWHSKLSNCDYVMVNEQSLSVCIPNSTGEQIDEHNPICMPFSEAGNLGGAPRQPNLHGAPMAREKKVTVYIPDLAKVAKDRINELEGSVKYIEYINQKFKKGITGYYDENPAASVVSIPIFRYKVDPGLFADDSFLEKTETISCILNIYATKKYMFQNSDMANAYSDLLRTICFVFSVLVSLRMSLACFSQPETITSPMPGPVSKTHLDEASHG